MPTAAYHIKAIAIGHKKGRYFSTLYFIQHHHGSRFIALAFLISFLC